MTVVADNGAQLTPLHLPEESQDPEQSKSELSALEEDEESPSSAKTAEQCPSQDKLEDDDLQLHQCNTEDHPSSRIDHSSGCCGCGKVAERCPRTFWFCSGIVLPLWLLIFVSSFLGLGLATLEAPKEIELNDMRLRNNFRLETVENSTRKIIALAPTLCFRLYLEKVHGNSTNNSSGEEWLVINFLSKATENHHKLAAAVDELNEVFEAEYDASIDLVENLTDAFLFLDECGQQVSKVVDDLQTPNSSLILLNETDIDYGDLTFNWNRCANGTNTTIIDIPWFGERTYQSYHPAAQNEYYSSTWERDLDLLYQAKYEELLYENATRTEKVEITLIALQYATDHATGEPACTVNVPAGCWFFFTVMTTIGYGNQSPETAPGRAMLYTLGFVSILLFAGVASRAGNITVCLFEDFVAKGRFLRRLNHPFVAPIYWGALYYIWLFLIAVTIDGWKRTRMDEDFGFDQGYWFAYISTTTVGLGDIYLDPEVIVTEDLMFFSFIFLIGFVFLASFLEKLSSLVKRNDHVGLAHLKTNLKKTNICCGAEIVGASRRLGTSVVFIGQALASSPQSVTEIPRQAAEQSHATGVDTPTSANDASDSRAITH